VFNDADVESAVNGVTFASFVASGQTCVSGARIIVQDEIYDSFMVKFLEKVKSVAKRMGDRTFKLIYPLTLCNYFLAMNPKSSMGTVISMHHLERIGKMVEGRSSGDILTGGHRLTSTSELDGYDFSLGSFYAPTVIANISTDDELWKEEVGTLSFHNC
jgi:acyl-CoA reductase-like NAD-dependent aldehyde dehydrogenase